MSATTTLRMILLGDSSSADKALRNVGDETDKTSKKMQTFHKVGTAAGVALAGGLVLAGKAAIDMTKKAAADQAGAERLAQTLQKATGATKSQTDAVEGWISSQEKALGVSDDDLRPALSKLAVATGSVAKAQKLASLAMDVSAGTGKSLESVSMALAKAQNGNISGLGRLGIATKNAKGETLSLTEVTKQLSAHYGGAAAASAQTAAGKQRILKVEYQELQEQIGAGLLPVMSKLLTIGLAVVNWISHNTKLAGVLVGVLGGLVAVTWAVSAATKAWAAITKIAAATQWLLNAALDANPIGLVVIALAALVVGLVIAYKKSDTFRHIVQTAFHAVLNAAQTAFGWIKHNWPLLLGILGGPVGVAAVLIIKNWSRIKAATQVVWSAIKGIVRDAWSAIKAVTVGQIQAVVGLISGAAGRIQNLGGTFLSAGKSLIHSLFSGIRRAATSGMGFVGDILSAIRGAINTALHLPLYLPKVNTHIPGVGTVGGELLLPALAKGGIVTRPTMALIGEAGPEAVVPLTGRNAGAGLALGNGGDLGTFALDLKLDGKTMQTVLLRLKRERGNVSLGLA